jgi:hypothetical protein
MTTKPKTRKAPVTSVSTVELARGLSERRLSDGSIYFVGNVPATPAARKNGANEAAAKRTKRKGK